MFADWRHASPLGEGERTKVRGLELLLLVALHRGLLPASRVVWRAQTLTSILSPLTKEKGETNTMGPTTGEHYRIALKSYSQWHHRYAMITFLVS